jgi:hypothetical protein
MMELQGLRNGSGSDGIDHGYYSCALFRRQTGALERMKQKLGELNGAAGEKELLL